jgi:hypothetical protein
MPLFNYYDPFALQLPLPCRNYPRTEGKNAELPERHCHCFSIWIRMGCLVGCHYRDWHYTCQRWICCSYLGRELPRKFDRCYTRLDISIVDIRRSELPHSPAGVPPLHHLSFVEWSFGSLHFLLASRHRLPASVRWIGCWILRLGTSECRWQHRSAPNRRRQKLCGRMAPIAGNRARRHHTTSGHTHVRISQWILYKRLR